MYWYSKKYFLVFTCLAMSLTQYSCQRDNHAVKNTKRYFDLKAYFAADSARLSKSNPWVTKTVTHNGVSQTKKIHIPNWGNEFSLFIGSDINKPAWAASYTVQYSDDFIIYQAKDPDLKTQHIVIKRNGNKVQWIFIYNHTKNVLYEAIENLAYFPDSLYRISRMERVRLLGTQKYFIKGTLN